LINPFYQTFLGNARRYFKMAKTAKAAKVINFPMKPSACDEAGALWIFMISSIFPEDYSCDYKYDSKHWTITIKSSTLQGAVALEAECRRALGWERKEAVSL